LTSFKIVSEYIISAILLSSLILLLYRRKYFDGNVLLLLCISIAMSIAGEFAFTTYASVFGISNFIGHILVFISFYLIYKALIETGLNKPYDLLFRDLKRSEEELRTLSMIDALTGLYNRRGFLDVAEKQLKISNRLKTEALVFYIDLDGMKWINDKLGHKEGDVALARTAGILKDTFRESDFIGRIGGDEFVILATATHQNYVNVIIKRLKERLDIHNARVKQQYKLSLSMGMASYDPEHHRLIGELIEQADKAMYLQKNAKGNNRK